MATRGFGRRLTATVAALAMAVGVAVVGASPALADTVETTVNLPNCAVTHVTFDSDPSDTGLVTAIKTNIAKPLTCPVVTSLTHASGTFEVAETISGEFGAAEVLELVGS